MLAAFAAGFTWVHAAPLAAQAPEPRPPVPNDHTPALGRPFAGRLTVLAGLSQPLAFGGGNAEVQYYTRRFVAEYSHGWSLEVSDVRSAMRGADRAQHLGVRMPWTTGGGFGVRLTERLHATLDAKVHRVEVALPGGEAARYTTYTLGPAAGYVLPVWHGLEVQPVIRWWPNVATSLDGGWVALRRADGTRFEHRAYAQGPGGLNGNVKLGWRF